MKRKLWSKLISFLLALTTLFAALPMTAFANEAATNAVNTVYIKSVQLVRADSKEDAKKTLEAEGYIFLDGDLNEGTGEDGIWLGYQTTTNPEEAVYDMKLMNMNGGFTLTSMREAIASQEELFTGMAIDLNYLIEEFVEAYEGESVPALKAYKALNFFRMVDGEKKTELNEENGLGYHIVSGKMTISKLTEMLLLCDSSLVDSIVKILTTGIQIQNGNWMKELSEIGPYDSMEEYYDVENEDEFKRRAEELLPVLQLYSQAYNAMDLSGLIPDRLNASFEAEYSEDDKPDEKISADDAAVKKLDESRYKIYKIVFDELDKYSYGTNKTLKDFFCSLENEGSTKDLYPLVSVLSDGEFAALSYGCFLELATGVGSEPSDFEEYDEMYAAITEEVSSVYLYHGVDKVFFDEDSKIGFTETATRHMATTGELEFYEKESLAEDIWETGKNVALLVGCAGMAIVGVAKLTAGVAMGVSAIAGAVGSSLAESAILCGIIKVGSAAGGPLAMLCAIDLGIRVAIVSLIISVIVEEINGRIDWDANPMPDYLYDVKEVSISQSSINDGIATEYVKKPVFTLYEAVTDKDGQVVDLNAHSKDASQWIGMYVSYDHQGVDAKPIEAKDLWVRTGNGITPEGYVPLARFGEVIACNLNQWDEDDDVNGVYVFYKQDQTVSVDDGRTYYIYDVYLQTGESDTHCIELLKAAGYTPLNINLSPSLTDDDIIFKDRIYTYLGYKTTTNKNNAIRDIRVFHGPAQGQIQIGAATYADCGSNGQITLYATKYATAGTPLLSGGLICVDDRGKAPRGYEPVCAISGGAAVSLNVNKKGVVSDDSKQTYLFFLPETTFTGGTRYVGDVVLMNIKDLYEHVQDNTNTQRPQKPTVGPPKTAPKTISDFWSCYVKLTGIFYNDLLLCYPTYNPYRAIYDIKAGLRDDYTNILNFQGVGYVSFNLVDILYTESDGVTYYNMEYGNLDSSFTNKMNGTFYLSGNPVSDNTHVVSESGEASNAMNKAQPILMTSLVGRAIFQDKDKAANQQHMKLSSDFKPVTDLFSNSKDAAKVRYKKGLYDMELYVYGSDTNTPYISNIYAMDKYTIFRSVGGYDSGYRPSEIAETTVLTQLANMGATHFCGMQIVIEHGYDSANEYEVSSTNIGYRRTSENSKALRDIFLYYNDFSTDDPPKELYRGDIKYTVVCEIPYNLTAYDSAPKPGIYIYGTTDKNAGNPITELDISTTPFMNGYETVRTKNGRSLWAEIVDSLKARKEAHPMDTAKNVYSELISFFEFDRDKANQHNAYFYVHIKREGEDLRKQTPYVGEIYISGSSNRSDIVFDDLFDRGAETYVNVDLNKDASSDYHIYLGYSFTNDPDKAYRALSAYHESGPPDTLTDDDGIKYSLIEKLDLNKSAFGDYIYLYGTKDPAAGNPIISLSGGYEVVTGEGTHTMADGTTVKTTTNCTKRWGTNSYSDLNRWAGGKYVYLMYTSADTTFKGTVVDRFTGTMLFEREDYEDKAVNGKYIGGLYVMDKNTILQEKIAAGTLPAGSKCDMITDDEVKERLKTMGATTIVETPISVTGATYFKNNKNVVYIGYSRTNKSKKAIRSIAIKADVMSIGEPKDQIEAGGNTYNLVAEAAKDVTELPKAINLISIDNGQDLLVPTFYLYYSTTTDDDPIYDISIDSNPLKNGWVTARSANMIDPYADISAQAKEHYDLAHDDATEFAHNHYDVYALKLSYWQQSISNHFKPENEDITPFYIHMNHYKDTTVEEEKPYIGEVFVAEGKTKYAALAELMKYGVECYIDVSLNQDAGGRHVYMGYNRTERERDALTDIVVFQGKNPDLSKRIKVGANSVRYTLVGDVDLNSKAGGKWLYMYSSDSSYTGAPITALRIVEGIVHTATCGKEDIPAKRADGDVITTEFINLNKGAGGDDIYLIMSRNNPNAGHSFLRESKTVTFEATCGDYGSVNWRYVCQSCGKIEYGLINSLAPTGMHVDEDGDWDHDCDECGAENVTAHVQSEVEREDEDEATCISEGSYHAVVYCVECEEELRNTVLSIPIDPEAHYDSRDEDHNCDLCGALNIEEHTASKPTQSNRIEPTEDTDGSYVETITCTECKAVISKETVILPALNKEGKDEDGTDKESFIASLFGSGSGTVICTFLAIAIIAGILIFLQKKKKDSEGENDNG